MCVAYIFGMSNWPMEGARDGEIKSHLSRGRNEDRGPAINKRSDVKGKRGFGGRCERNSKIPFFKVFLRIA